ncbi:hypothetical protein Tco_0228585 [Tanacetum coccineum]
MRKSCVRTVDKIGILEASVRLHRGIYESWVMDSGALFHATRCMGMMKKFNPLLGKLRLADMKNWVVEANGT